MKKWYIVLILGLAINSSGQGRRKGDEDKGIVAKVTAHSTVLSWNLGVITGGTGTITGTKIYASTTPGGESLANPLATVNAPTNTYTDTAVIAGGTKYYKATSTSTVGESVFSTEAGPFVTPQDPSVPQPPTGLTGTPQ
jgi:fibronectin type 3 domain-containing protein